MTYTFLIVALIIAVLDWIAVAKQWTRAGYLTKPGVMLALLVWLWQAGGFNGHLIWFAAGLLFSLAGDVFLMLPREQFIAGLVSFLLAHLAYLAGFNASLPPASLASLAVALLVGLTAGQLYHRLSVAIETSGHKKLKTPVLVYSAVISLMLVAALLTLVRAEWLAGPALIASSGALLFFLSDALLAWNRFVTPLPYGRLRVRITYHLGQALIMLGAVSHFLLLE